jgi:hypothetical protein
MGKEAERQSARNASLCFSSARCSTRPPHAPMSCLRAPVVHSTVPCDVHVWSGRQWQEGQYGMCGVDWRLSTCARTRILRDRAIFGTTIRIRGYGVSRACRASLRSAANGTKSPRRMRPTRSPRAPPERNLTPVVPFRAGLSTDSVAMHRQPPLISLLSTDEVEARCPAVARRALGAREWGSRGSSRPCRCCCRCPRPHRRLLLPRNHHSSSPQHRASASPLCRPCRTREAARRGSSAASAAWARTSCAAARGRGTAAARARPGGRVR